MTAEEATKLGYQIGMAAEELVGLWRNGKQIRTWWMGNFPPPSLPTLTHPLVMDCIRWEEDKRKKEEQLCQEKIPVLLTEPGAPATNIIDLRPYLNK